MSAKKLVGCIKKRNRKQRTKPKNIRKASAYTAVCYLVLSQTASRERWRCNHSTDLGTEEPKLETQTGTTKHDRTALSKPRAVPKPTCSIFSLDISRNLGEERNTWLWFQGLPRGRWQKCFITSPSLMMICNERVPCSHVGSGQLVWLAGFADCYLLKASCCELSLTTAGEVLQRTRRLSLKL